MTIQFKTDAVYTLGHANASLRLICTYIEDNTIWFSTQSILKSDTYPASDTTLLYKYERKTSKLYVFNTKVQAYDLVEGSLSEYVESHIFKQDKWHGAGYQLNASSVWDT